MIDCVWTANMCLLLPGIILAPSLRAPMAHRKNLRAPFSKTVRYVIIGHKFLQKTLLLSVPPRLIEN